MEKLKPNSIYSVFIILLLFIENGCTSRRMEKDFYQNVLGVNAIPEKQVFLYSEESANNDGFSFEIIRVNLDDDLKFSQNYPISDEFRKGMQISKWQKTPALTMKDFDIIFKYHLDKPKVSQKIKEAQKVLMSEGSFYCYFFRKESEYVESIDLYILDVKNKLIYNFNVVI
ncbi:hypothetical protein [Sphingobacterium sp. LRF_L2]|uniref:hypothetical protein n=1 Tax=Sphingobacterium sp. LRF_L2 TaxID=3369421 RepID=UPI003F619428